MVAGTPKAAQLKIRVENMKNDKVSGRVGKLIDVSNIIPPFVVYIDNVPPDNNICFEGVHLQF